MPIKLNSLRRVTRTVFQAIVGIAAMAPLIYQAAANRSPEAAAGWIAVALTVCGAVTRVMALPAVEGWLARFVPWLAAQPATETGPNPRDEDVQESPDVD